MRIFNHCAACLLLLSGAAVAKPVVIYGNAYGLWSPSHPHLTKGMSKPRGPVRYVPPEPLELSPVEEPVIVNDVCPTIQSAPHLCQT